MTHPEQTPARETAEREIVITRLLDAPCERVFQAWTEPEDIAHWWGPNGFTTTIHEMAVKPGGVWRLTMHGPDGVDYPNQIEYTEVTPPERLVYVHRGDSDHTFHVTVTFEEEGGKTRLTLRSLFDTADERNLVVEKYDAIEGGKQTLERLAVHLASVQGVAGKEFAITRVFEAPCELVFKAWTEAERLAQWWGPKGMATSVQRLDLRPGGVLHYRIVLPDGQAVWGKFVFREITPPRRLVFVVSFSDEQEGVTRHPMSQNWPLEVLNTLTLTEEDGKTTLTLRGVPVNATEVERQTFEGGFDSMRQGFGGTMDQLYDYLAKARG